MGVLLCWPSRAGGIDFTSEDLSSEEATLKLYKRGAAATWTTTLSDSRSSSRVRERSTTWIRVSCTTADTSTNFPMYPKTSSMKATHPATQEPRVAGRTRHLPWRPVRDYANDNIPENVDWRSRGAVTAVRVQNGCVCCRAFAAAGAVEAAHQIENGVLMPLSVQELLNYSSLRNGWKGGNAAHGYRYIAHYCYWILGYGHVWDTSKTESKIAVQPAVKPSPQLFWFPQISHYSWSPIYFPLCVCRLTGHRQSKAKQALANL